MRKEEIGLVAPACEDCARLQMLDVCCWSLTKAVEIMDHAGLVLRPSEASESGITLIENVFSFAPSKRTYPRDRIRINEVWGVNRCS